MSIVDEADSSMSSCGSGSNGTALVVGVGGNTSETTVAGSKRRTSHQRFIERVQIFAVTLRPRQTFEFRIPLAGRQPSAREWAARPQGILQVQFRPVPAPKPDHQPRVTPQVLHPRLEEVAPLALSPETEMTRLARR
jgi:hypothetical protein